MRNLTEETQEILLGFEIPTGEPVKIPLRHTLVTGLTQESGKTTLIQGLIERSGLRAIVFLTKRGERGFERSSQLPICFREHSDWRFVSAILESTLHEKVKWERSWVVNACRGTHGRLREVSQNVDNLLASPKLRGIDRGVFTNLQAYFELVFEDMTFNENDYIATIHGQKITKNLDIKQGVNVMNLEALSDEIQTLIIRSVMEYVLEKESNLIIVVPEAWKFLPQGRNTPVKLLFERFIRQGAAIGNYLVCDSQDIGGIEKTELRSMSNWILGKQREEHEVERTLDAIPLEKSRRPKALDIMTLQIGHFYATYGTEVKLVYALPYGIPEEMGIAIAQGKLPIANAIQALNHLREGLTWNGFKEEEDYDLSWKEPVEVIKKQVQDLKSVGVGTQETIERIAKKIDKVMSDVKSIQDQMKTTKITRSPLQVPRDSKEGKTDLEPTNITLEEHPLAIYITHKGEREIDMNTDTRDGQILYTAVKDLPLEGWSWTDMMNALVEHGWGMARTTLASNLSSLRNHSLLVKTKDGYRLPKLVTFKPKDKR